MGCARRNPEQANQDPLCPFRPRASAAKGGVRCDPTPMLGCLMTLILEILWGGAIVGVAAVSTALFVTWWTNPHQIDERALCRLLRRNPKR